MLAYDFYAGLPACSQAALMIASPAMPAVSARKIEGPSETGVHAAFANSTRSSSVHPPSGPTSNATLAVICRDGGSALSKGVAPAFSSSA